MVTVIVCSYLFLKIPNIHGFENLPFQMFSAPGLSAHPTSACPLQKHPGFLQLFPCSFQEARNHQQRFVVVVQWLRPTLCNPTDCSTPGLPVPHHLPELAQTHVHWIGDAIQPSHPLPSPSPPSFQQRLLSLCPWFGAKPRISLFPSLPSHLSLLPPSPTRVTTQNVRP